MIRVHYRINPGAREQLFPSTGEYATAVKAGALRGLPTEVVLTLYGYELAERMRDQLGRGAQPASFDVPLWPLSLFVAADIGVHAGRELARLYPRARSVEVAPPELVPIVADARALFGELCFDPERYAAHLAMSRIEDALS